jgi:hypothetical protein
MLAALSTKAAPSLHATLKWMTFGMPLPLCERYCMIRPALPSVPSIGPCASQPCELPTVVASGATIACTVTALRPARKPASGRLATAAPL